MGRPVSVKVDWVERCVIVYERAAKDFLKVLVDLTPYFFFAQSSALNKIKQISKQKQSKK